MTHSPTTHINWKLLKKWCLLLMNLFWNFSQYYYYFLACVINEKCFCLLRSIRPSNISTNLSYPSTNLFIDLLLPPCNTTYPLANSQRKEREVEVGKIKLSTNCKGQGPLEEKRRDLLPNPKGRVIIGEKKELSTHPFQRRGWLEEGKKGGGDVFPTFKRRESNWKAKRIS